ncbi:MAG: Fic family protein, partial [Dehalococcoidia bacterium]|nr:Fic family protein [Dehalococcoidia bacterium]
REAGRQVGPEAVEILANIDALELAVEQRAATESIGPEDLLDIHRVLLARDAGGRTPGEFRHSQNWIGGNDYNPCGADFVPPPPEEVEGLVEDLCGFCNPELLPPLLQAAIAHAQFETIHPFVDGSGRTGRALVQAILRRRGLAPTFVPPISVMFSRQRGRYISGLTAFREDRLVEWITIFATATAEAAQLAERCGGQVAQLQDRWRHRLLERSNPRADAAAWRVIDVLPAHPMVTVPIAVVATGRTRPAVTNGIDELERAGVLIPLAESRRNRVWEPAGLLDVVTRLESGDG